MFGAWDMQLNREFWVQGLTIQICNQTEISVKYSRKECWEVEKRIFFNWSMQLNREIWVLVLTFQICNLTEISVKYLEK